MAEANAEIAMTKFVAINWQNWGIQDILSKCQRGVLSYSQGCDILNIEYDKEVQAAAEKSTPVSTTEQRAAPAEASTSEQPEETLKVVEPEPSKSVDSINNFVDQVMSRFKDSPFLNKLKENEQTLCGNIMRRTAMLADPSTAHKHIQSLTALFPSDIDQITLFKIYRFCEKLVMEVKGLYLAEKTKAGGMAMDYEWTSIDDDKIKRSSAPLIESRDAPNETSGRDDSIMSGYLVVEDLNPISNEAKKTPESPIVLQGSSSTSEPNPTTPAERDQPAMDVIDVDSITNKRKRDDEEEEEELIVEKHIVIDGDECEIIDDPETIARINNESERLKTSQSLLMQFREIVQKSQNLIDFEKAKRVTSVKKPPQPKKPSDKHSKRNHDVPTSIASPSIALPAEATPAEDTVESASKPDSANTTVKKGEPKSGLAKLVEECERKQGEKDFVSQKDLTTGVADSIFQLKAAVLDEKKQKAEKEKQLSVANQSSSKPMNATTEQSSTLPRNPFQTSTESKPSTMPRNPFQTSTESKPTTMPRNPFQKATTNQATTNQATSFQKSTETQSNTTQANPFQKSIIVRPSNPQETPVRGVPQPPNQFQFTRNTISPETDAKIKRLAQLAHESTRGQIATYPNANFVPPAINTVPFSPAVPVNDPNLIALAQLMHNPYFNALANQAQQLQQMSSNPFTRVTSQFGNSTPNANPNFPVPFAFLPPYWNQSNQFNGDPRKN